MSPVARERLIWLLGAIGLALGVWWIVANTEWVEEERPVGQQGEALTNPVYAAEQTLRRLHLKVEHHDALDQLPPRGARLVLLSNDWELLPGKAEQLKQWVQGGGHLVVPMDIQSESNLLADWLPATEEDRKTRKKEAASAVEPASGPAKPPIPVPPVPQELYVDSVPPLWDDIEGLAVCNLLRWRRLVPKADVPIQWRLEHDGGLDALRVAVGKGSVTLLDTAYGAFDNVQTLRCDNALLLAAAVQAEPGATVWFYLNEKREPLLPWLWNGGWIAIVTAGLALAALLWRGTLRFGPRVAVPPRFRRSIGEQVRGTGAWLQRHGREALIAAQLRALEDTAGRVLPRYRRLKNKADRAKAIAAATGVASEPLAAIFNEASCKRAELPERLRALENARRLLLNKTPGERTS
jgi:hypothetical protein